MLGYRQLYEIERVDRDLQHTVDVRPVYHQREDRIRVAEDEAGETWHQLQQ